MVYVVLYIPATSQTQNLLCYVTWFMKYQFDVTYPMVYLVYACQFIAKLRLVGLGLVYQYQLVVTSLAAGLCLESCILQDYVWFIYVSFHYTPVWFMYASHTLSGWFKCVCQLDVILLLAGLCSGLCLIFVPQILDTTHTGLRPIC